MVGDGELFLFGGLTGEGGTEYNGIMRRATARILLPAVQR